MMNIYVGNIPYAATKEDLETLFGEYGTVATATIIRDRDDGRSKGFGFVEMENREDGERAIEALDGQEMMGRPLKVNPARDDQRRHSYRQDSDKGEPKLERRFHNPYTFVPTPPRDKIGAGEFAGDFNPLEHPCGKEHNLDHASLKPNLWTGHIPIKLTTVTPLVLLKGDGEDRSTDTHQTYDVLDYLPETSLRGMLRNAYEVATNSRYACFSNDDRLAYRMAPRKAIELIPAIIENVSGKLVVRLYPGTSQATPQGPSSRMYAAMLDTNLKYVSGDEPKTRDEVWAEIVPRSHRNYSYWKAIKVWSKIKNPTKPSATGKIVEGRVFITNENMGNKHDERIFFTPQSKTFDLTVDLKEAWRMRIQSYRDAHNREELFGRKDRDGNKIKAWEKIGNSPGKTAWSPHLYQDGQHEDRWGRNVHDACILQEHDMVYARCEFDPVTKDVKCIKDLFPVMISRELYVDSPVDLLDCSLKPAKARNELSPADRLFGWVPQKQGDDTGYKSRIRVVCGDRPRPEIVQRFDGGNLPLTILGQPKPAQGRFYVAKDEKGTPQHGKSKENAGYKASQGKKLRGRKQYWHHKGLEANKALEYWHPSVEDRTQEKYNGRYQEYRRPNEYGRRNGKPKEDSQGRLISGWVKPGTIFKASLYVQNLQPQEVGGLIWLLTLNNKIGDEGEKHYFRLGYGKPLGFGSMKIEIDEAQLVDDCLPLGTGKDWKAYYANTDLSVSSPAKMDSKQQAECIGKFETSMKNAYKHIVQCFDDLPFIKGFLQILRGPISDYSIHYPRLEHKPNPEGRNFEWFTANERGNNKHALPAATDDNGLPYKP